MLIVAKHSPAWSTFKVKAINMLILVILNAQLVVERQGSVRFSRPECVIIL